MNLPTTVIDNLTHGMNNPAPDIPLEDMPAVLQVARWIRRQQRLATKKPKTRLKRVKRNGK